MKVHIQRRNTVVPPATEAAILERIHFALGRLSHRIRTLRVGFDDLNGPRGGVDKLCTIEAVLDHRSPIVVEGTDHGVVAAGTRAARRLARRVSDEFERSRDLRRRGTDDILMSLQIDRV
jgi:putative sigma-54 modulation protein